MLELQEEEKTVQTVKAAKRSFVGLVTSEKMDKTIVVKVASYNPHPKYKKIIETNKNYKAHDEANECGIGDTVEIMETRPLSKDKRYRLVRIVEKAK